MGGTLQVLRQENALGWTEAVFRVPDPRLRHYIDDNYLGWTERVARPQTMRETPTTIIPIILNLGPPWRLTDWVGRSQHLDSFLSGLDERYTQVEFAGNSCCIQVNFTPLGALRVLGCPLSEIAHRIVPIEDVLGRDGRVLIARLRAAREWTARFDLLERFILARFAASHDALPEAAWMWRTLRAHDGLIPVGELATELGWSQRRAIAAFRHHFGLTPKRAARVMRFQRAVRSLNDVPAPRWAEIAAECGYYDQAHLNRDFREFAGLTPAEYFAGILPNYGVPGY